MKTKVLVVGNSVVNLFLSLDKAGYIFEQFDTSTDANNVDRSCPGPDADAE
jgi:hypothetical protein